MKLYGHNSPCCKIVEEKALILIRKKNYKPIYFVKCPAADKVDSLMKKSMITPRFLWCVLLMGLLSCRQEEAAAPALTSCWQDRQTLETVTDGQGNIAFEDGVLVIDVDNANELLEPCNLPEAYRENDQVVFSGNKKEIFPNERRAGQPFELTSIRKQ